MKKLIDIPEKYVTALRVNAAYQNKDLKNYIQDVLIDAAEAGAKRRGDKLP